MGAGVVEGHVGVRHAHPVIAGLRGMHLVAGCHQRRIAVDDEVGCTLIGFRHVLRNLSHPPLARDGKIAAIFMQRAIEQPEQRRFASTVAADKAHLFAGIKGDGGLVQQHFRTTAQGNVREDDHEEFFREWRE